MDALSRVASLCTLAAGFAVGFFVISRLSDFTNAEIPDSILAVCNDNLAPTKLEEAKTLLKKHSLTLTPLKVTDEPDLEEVRDFIWDVDSHPYRQSLIEPALAVVKSEIIKLKGKRISKLGISFALQPAAVLFVDANDLSFSKAVAKELESSQETFSLLNKIDWHDTYQLSGLIAAKENRIEEAKRLLMKSVEHFEPTTSSFGPSMRLAKVLIERKEYTTVEQYFKKCKEGWSFAKDSGIDSWISAVDAKKMPTGEGWDHQLGYF